MMTIQQVRAALKSIPRRKRCDPTCRGWEIFHVDRGPGVEIEGCDDCLSSLPKAERPTDEDIAQLPDAREALAREVEGQYNDLEAYDMDRALSLIAEWIDAGKGQKATLTAISNILRGAGYDTDGR